MTTTLSDEERRFLEVFVAWHRERYSEEYSDDREDGEIDAFLRETMEDGFSPPVEEYHDEIAERAGIDDYRAMMDRLEEEGIVEQEVDVMYRLQREDDDDVEDRKLRREVLVFDPAVLEVIFG